MSTVAQLFTDKAEALEWAASPRALHKHVAGTRARSNTATEANPGWARALLKFTAYTTLQLCLVVRRDKEKNRILKCHPPPPLQNEV